MRMFERLLPAEEDVQNEVTDEHLWVRTTCFWISYSIFILAVGAVSLWLFFRFIVMAP